MNKPLMLSVRPAVRVLVIVSALGTIAAIVFFMPWLLGGQRSSVTHLLKSPGDVSGIVRSLRSGDRQSQEATLMSLAWQQQVSDPAVADELIAQTASDGLPGGGRVIVSALAKNSPAVFRGAIRRYFLARPFLTDSTDSGLDYLVALLELVGIEETADLDMWRGSGGNEAYVQLRSAVLAATD